jgi:DNA replication factor GINS
MDLSELHRVKRQERSTDSLQELRESFYEDVAAYIAELREKRSEAAAAAADPFRSARVSELTSEIETAEQVAEAIYQRRIGKLVDEASLAATGNGNRMTGLTAEEQSLYEDLVERISENRDAVLGRFDGDDEPGEDDATEVTAPEGGTADDPADSPGSHPPDAPIEGAGTNQPTGGDTNGPPDSNWEANADDEADSGGTASAEEAAVERTTVRMTDDVGEIFGVDAKTYDLERDDVVDLPRENADPLLDRDVAERVE